MSFSPGIVTYKSQTKVEEHELHFLGFLGHEAQLAKAVQPR